MATLPTDETFHTALLGDDHTKTVEQRNMEPFLAVQLYAKRARTNDSNSPPYVFVGTATTVPHRENQDGLTRILHGQAVTDHEIVLCSFKLPQVADNPIMTKMISEIHYPYTFNSINELPATLGELVGEPVFLWDVRALRRVPARYKNTITHTETPEQGQNTNAQASTSGQQQSSNSQANSAQGGNSSSGQAGNANTPVATNDDNSADVNKIVLLNSDEENERDQEQEDNRGVHFNHKVLKQSEYVHVIVRAKISQISDFEHPLRTIDENHKNALRGKFLDPAIGFQPKTSGLMTTTILRENMGENEMVHDLLTKHPGQVAGSTPIYTLNNGRTMTIVDGRHRRGAILDCSNMEQPETNWSRDYIQFSLIIRRDNNLLSEWEVLMFSKQKNDSSSLVRATSTVVDLLSGIVSYARIFRSTYDIDYLDARISTIADDMLNSQFLSFAKSTVRKYVRLSRCLLKFDTVKTFIFEECPLTNCKDGGRNNMSYFTDNNLLAANEEDMLLMLKCVTGFYENVDKGKFKPDHFYKTCKMFISETRQYFQRISSIPESSTTASYPKTYSAFMTTTYRLNNTLDTTPQDYIISTMSGYSFSSNDEGKSTNSIIKRAATRMKSKLDDRYLLGKKDAPTKSGPGIVGSAIPRRRNRKRSIPIIDLGDSDDQPEKKKRKTSASTGTGRGGKRIPKGSRRTKATLRPAGGNSAASAQVSGGGAGDDNASDDDEERRFDDSFDVSRPPTNWEQQHAASMRMRDDDITKEFFMNIRSIHKVTSEELGEEWDAEHVIRQQEGSAAATGQEVQDPSAYLRSVHIPKDHRSHVFVPLEHFKVLRSLATFWGIHGEIFHSRSPADKSDNPEENWTETLIGDPYMCKSFFNSKQTELEYRGYTILPGMADPLSFPQNSIDSVLPIPDNFPTMTVVELFDAIHKMFPGEDKLREEEDRENWNPIINSRNAANDENDRNMGIGRYSTTNKFLTETLEKGDYVHLAQRRAYLDVWIGIMVSLLNIDDNGKVNVYVPRTGGRWLLTGRYCKIQVGHNDFHIIVGNICPGYFAIVTGAERVYLWVCPGSHQYVHYNKKEREGLSANLKMERIEIPPNSIFIGHGHLQHAGDGYNGSHCVRYHTYIAPEDVEIPDAIIFGYENALGCLNAQSDANADGPDDTQKSSASSTKRYPPKSKHGRSTKNVVSRAEENESDEEDDDPLDENYTLDLTAIPDV